MPSIHTKIDYNLHLSTQELRLILKALGGRLTTPAEIEEAKQLGVDIAGQWGKQALELVKQNEKLLVNLEQAPGAAQLMQVPKGNWTDLQMFFFDQINRYPFSARESYLQNAADAFQSILQEEIISVFNQLISTGSIIGDPSDKSWRVKTPERKTINLPRGEWNEIEQAILVSLIDRPAHTKDTLYEAVCKLTSVSWREEQFTISLADLQRKRVIEWMPHDKTWRVAK